MTSLKNILIFARRDNSSYPWSDSIENLYKELIDKFESCHYLPVSTANPCLALLSLASAAIHVASVKDWKRLTIIVNHSIVFYILLPLLLILRLSGAKVLLLVHEHEQILGLGYVISSGISNFGLQSLRYCRLYHKLPALLSSIPVVLAHEQVHSIGIRRYARHRFLSVDASLFPPAPLSMSNHGIIRVLFPHDVRRYDKGYRFVTALQQYTYPPIQWKNGREAIFQYDKVFQKYWSSDAIFLPSDWESLSLVLIEALSCNIFVVTNKNVGSVLYLLENHAIDELRGYGLYVCDHTVSAYYLAFCEISERLNRNDAPRTGELFRINNLEKPDLSFV